MSLAWHQQGMKILGYGRIVASSEHSALGFRASESEDKQRRVFEPGTQLC